MKFTYLPRKAKIILSAFFILTIAVIYLYAMFIPGIWYGDAFLYKQKDGSFTGSDCYAEYGMEMHSSDNKTNISFSVNNKSNTYTVIKNADKSIYIYKNNELSFDGKAISDESYILIDSNGNPDIHIVGITNNYTPSESELYPTNSQLYKWSITSTERRGNFYMIIFIIILAVILCLDIRFPLLFYKLKHGLDVYGGEPSDFYLFGQQAGRYILAGGILICMILSFTIH